MDSRHQEQFSVAYIKALAARAEAIVTTPTIDKHSCDLMVTGYRPHSTGIVDPQLHLQVKSTTQISLISNTHINYPLPKNNYDDLRQTNVLCRRLLIVMTLPDNMDLLLSHSEEQLILRKCAYWYDLKSLPETQNTTTVTVNIPRVQLFNVDALNDLLDQAAAP